MGQYIEQLQTEWKKLLAKNPKTFWSRRRIPGRRYKQRNLVSHVVVQKKKRRTLTRSRRANSVLRQARPGLASARSAKSRRGARPRAQSLSPTGQARVSPTKVSRT